MPGTASALQGPTEPLIVANRGAQSQQLWSGQITRTDRYGRTWVAPLAPNQPEAETAAVSHP
jgi:hypothetical protein